MKFKNNIHTWITDDTPTMPSHCNCNGSGRCTNRTSVKVGWPCSNKNYVQTCHRPQTSYIQSESVPLPTHTYRTQPQRPTARYTNSTNTNNRTRFLPTAHVHSCSYLTFTWGEIDSATTSHTTNLMIDGKTLKWKPCLLLFKTDVQMQNKSSTAASYYLTMANGESSITNVSSAPLTMKPKQFLKFLKHPLWLPPMPDSVCHDLESPFIHS